MKKLIILFLVSLLIPTVSFSQTIYPKILNDSLIVITPIQLKQCNLIFIEHEKQKLLIPQLENKIISLNKINSILEKSDSLRNVQNQKDFITINNNLKTIDNLNEQIRITKSKKKRLRNWTIGGFSLSALFGILWLTK